MEVEGRERRFPGPTTGAGAFLGLGAFHISSHAQPRPLSEQVKRSKYPVPQNPWGALQGPPPASPPSVDRGLEGGRDTPGAKSSAQGSLLSQVEPPLSPPPTRGLGLRPACQMWLESWLHFLCPRGVHSPVGSLSKEETSVGVQKQFGSNASQEQYWKTHCRTAQVSPGRQERGAPVAIRSLTSYERSRRGSQEVEVQRGQGSSETESGHVPLVSHLHDNC